MTRTKATDPTQVDMVPPANGTTDAAVPTRPKHAYRFTAGRGSVACLWWEPTGPVVECDDVALRQRMQRALEQPIWIVEDELDEFGVQWSTRKHIQPDDPRYPAHWFWALGQVGLGDVKAEVVRVATKERVWPPWDASTDHLTEQF